MADYISREAAIEKIREAGCTDCGGSSGGICGFCDFENAVRLVNGLPAADVEPVRHGRWISWEDADNCIPSPNRHECSVCHDAAQVLVNGLELLSDYCPNCGAKMDLEDENE